MSSTTAGPPAHAVPSVVLDTCTVQAEGYLLRSPALRSLLAAARLGRVKVCVPEVVALELRDHYQEAVRKQAGALRRAADQINRLRAADDLSSVPDAAVDVDVERWSGAYDSYLRALVGEHGRLLPVPKVSHEELLRSVIAGRKPFTSGDKGYKDALIWHSVLELAASYEGPVWFVTSNTRDFHAPDRVALAQDLELDLDAVGVHRGRFRIFTELPSLLDEVLPSEVGALDQFVAFVQSSAGGALIAEITDGLRVPLVDKEGSLPGWLLRPEVSLWTSVNSVIARDVRPLGDGSYSVTGVLTGRAIVDGGVDERSAEGPDDRWMEWDDWGVDYNLAYADPQLVEVGFEAIFRPPDEIEDVELGSAQLLEGALSPLRAKGLSLSRVAWEIACTLLRRPRDEMVAVWQDADGWGWRVGAAPSGVDVVVHDRVQMNDIDPTDDVREIGRYAREVEAWLRSLA